MSRRLKQFKDFQSILKNKEENNEKTWQEERDEELKLKNVIIRARTDNQSKVINSILTNVITIINGVSGTGKSTLCCGMAAKLLVEGKVNKIILTRPQIEVGNKTQGYYPGNHIEKLECFLLPIISYLKDFLGGKEVDRLRKEGIIELIPLGLLRSCSFKNSYIYCDESQNIGYAEAKVLLTRIDLNSRLVMAGDTDQKDIANCNDYELVINRLSDLRDEIGFVTMEIEDCQRAGIVKKILERL